MSTQTRTTIIQDTAGEEKPSTGVASIRMATSKYARRRDNNGVSEPDPWSKKIFVIFTFIKAMQFVMTIFELSCTMPRRRRAILVYSVILPSLNTYLNMTRLFPCLRHRPGRFDIFSPFPKELGS